MVKKYWIAQATKHKGALHKALGIPLGKKIPKSLLNKAAHKKGKIGREARLAKTLSRLHK